MPIVGHLSLFSPITRSEFVLLSRNLACRRRILWVKISESSKAWSQIADDLWLYLEITWFRSYRPVPMPIVGHPNFNALPALKQEKNYTVWKFHPLTLHWCDHCLVITFLYVITIRQSCVVAILRKIRNLREKIVHFFQNTGAHVVAITNIFRTWIHQV